ncbi:hypothetical protein BKA01_006978 [Pseudonocardia eucalypti]|nr:hypothetical protein [Pseudonocardia eucalypti]
MAAGAGLGVSLLAPVAGVAAPAWAGVPGAAPSLAGGLPPRSAGGMDCTSGADDDDDDEDLVEALTRAEPGDLVCVPLDYDETREDESDEADEHFQDTDEEDPAGHAGSRHRPRGQGAADQPAHHDHEQDQYRGRHHLGGNSDHMAMGEPGQRAMTSGERQYRSGCRHGYIAEDCERFSTRGLLRLGINPNS